MFRDTLTQIVARRCERIKNGWSLVIAGLFFLLKVSKLFLCFLEVCFLRVSSLRNAFQLGLVHFIADKHA